MPDNGPNASDERKLFGEKRDGTTLFVGSELGVMRVEVAGAQVGQFSLVERCSVRSIAADNAAAVVATDDSVLVATDRGFDSVGFGPAVAVGFDDSWLYAAAPDGRSARLARSSVAPDRRDWETVGTVTGPQQFDGDLLAADDGLFRLGSTVDRLGLTAVNSVSRAGPFAATDSGLYSAHDTEWVAEHDGDATAVTASDDTAYALADGTLFERVDSAWQQRQLPAESQPLLLAYAATPVVVSADGTLSIGADPTTSRDGHGGWRSQPLGVGDPTAIAVVEK